MTIEEINAEITEQRKIIMKATERMKELFIIRENAYNDMTRKES